MYDVLMYILVTAGAHAVRFSIPGVYSARFQVQTNAQPDRATHPSAPVASEDSSLIVVQANAVQVELALPLSALADRGSHVAGDVAI